MNKDKIVKHHNDMVEKLKQCLEGTEDFKAGEITNPLAPCLIRSAIADSIIILSEINKG